MTTERKCDCEKRGGNHKNCTEFCPCHKESMKPEQHLDSILQKTGRIPSAPTTPMNDFEEKVLDELDKIIRPLGAKVTLCSVPEINQTCQFWMLHNVEKEIKSFLLHSIREARAEGREEVIKEVLAWLPQLQEDMEDILDFYAHANANNAKKLNWDWTQIVDFSKKTCTKISILLHSLSKEK